MKIHPLSPVVRSIKIIIYLNGDSEAVEIFFFWASSTSYCLSLSISLPYLILAVSMHECLGKQSCMSSPFPIYILIGTLFFSWNYMIEVVEESPISKTNYNNMHWTRHLMPDYQSLYMLAILCIAMCFR